MLLRELIFQDLFGVTLPVRLDASSQLSNWELPAGVTPTDVQFLVAALLYPKEVPSAVKMNFAKSPDAKIAATVEHRGRPYRIVRRGEADSVRVQVKESSGWRDLASGTNDVAARLVESLGMPPMRAFWTANLWRLHDTPAEVTAFDPDSMPENVRRVVLKYRAAIAVERIEDAIKSTEGRIADRTKELGQGAALEDKLRKGKQRLAELEVAELSDEDLELLKQKDALMSDFDSQLQRLEAQEDSERNQIELVLPDHFRRVPWFWVGLVVGVGALAVAISDPSLRAVALADILGFGAVAWVLLHYFRGMERAAVHQVRLESIRRRLGQVREEQVGTQERVNLVLIHAGVKDAQEMAERIEKAEQLREMIGKMEKRVGDLRRDAGYMAALDDLEKQEKRLADLVAERKELPTDDMSAYQLENDLASLGIDPKLVLDDNPADRNSTVTDDADTPLGRCLAAATALGQFNGAELDRGTRKMWGKICGHILGDRFGSVNIGADGNLRIGELDSDQVAMWQKTRPSEHELLLWALALSIQVTAAEKSRKGSFDSVIIPDPAESLSGAQAKKLSEVFASAAQKSGIIVLRKT